MTPKPIPVRLTNFDEFTQLPALFFRTIGVPVFQASAPQTTRRQRLLRFFLFFVSFTNTALCVLGEIIFVCVTFGVSDFVDITSLVLCIGFILLSFAKVITIMWKQRQLTQLMHDLLRVFPQTHDAQLNYETAEYAAHAKRLMVRYSWVQMVMIWLFNFYPMTNTLMGYVQRGAWEVDFPYIIWYPFDPYGSGWFELNYFSQISAAYFSASAILGTDMLLCGVVLQICMHYDRLRRSLRTYRPNGQRHGQRDCGRMREYVRQHNEVLRMSAALDDIFGETILFNLVSSVVIVCVLGFLVLTAGQSVKLLKYFITLITCTGQIYMVCLLGEMFIKSVSVSSNKNLFGNYLNQV